MKTKILLPVLIFTALTVAGQSVSPPGAGNSSGAEYAQASLAPRVNGTAGQTSAGRASNARRSRSRGGTEYLKVSLAPRRNQP